MTKSYISNLSPEVDVTAFESMLKKNAQLLDRNLWATDLDRLLAAAEGSFVDGFRWRTPKGFPAGALLFVYQVQLAVGHAQSFRRASLRQGTKQIVRDHAFHVEHLAWVYSGRIFAVAQTAGESVPEGSGKYASPLRRVHVFPNPLPVKKFEKVVKPTTGAGQRLDAKQFDELRFLLLEENVLPGFLMRA